MGPNETHNFSPSSSTYVWGQKTSTAANTNGTSPINNTLKSPSVSKKSLLEIQQEEIDFHDNSVVSTGKWYLSEPTSSTSQDGKRKKDRSESLGAIQQEQE